MTMTASDRLRQAREGKGFRSAAAFARRHDITESTYRSHENGTRRIDPAAARRYADLLGVSAAWILFGLDGYLESPDSLRQSPDDQMAYIKEFAEKFALADGSAYRRTYEQLAAACDRAGLDLSPVELAVFAFEEFDAFRWSIESPDDLDKFINIAVSRLIRSARLAR